MAERQISIGQKSYALPDLFLVMATQNPLEQEGLTLSLKLNWIGFIAC